MVLQWIQIFLDVKPCRLLNAGYRYFEDPITPMFRTKHAKNIYGFIDPEYKYTIILRSLGVLLLADIAL
jgi:hypothetical protein